MRGRGGGYLLVSDDGSLLEDLHGVDAAFVIASDLADLEDLAVATLAEHLAKLKICKRVIDLNGRSKAKKAPNDTSITARLIVVQLG